MNIDVCESESILKVLSERMSGNERAQATARAASRAMEYGKPVPFWVFGLNFKM